MLGVQVIVLVFSHQRSKRGRHVCQIRYVTANLMKTAHEGSKTFQASRGVKGLDGSQLVFPIYNCASYMNKGTILIKRVTW